MLDDYQEMKLVNKAIMGDATAFETLLKANWEYIEKTARTYLTEDKDVEDAISAMTVEAYRGIKKLRRPEYFKTWLIRILIRQCYKRYDINHHENADLAGLPEMVEHASELSTEERLDVLAALKKLNQNVQQVLMMFYFNDLTIKEISETTGINENTVKSQLRRGKAQLRQWLGEEYYEK